MGAAKIMGVTHSIWGKNSHLLVNMTSADDSQGQDVAEVRINSRGTIMKNKLE